MKLSTLEQRRLELFEKGMTYEQIAEMENATVQGIKTTIWRAKAKKEGTYKAPERTGSTKKKGFNFKEADMEKVNFIKESFKNRYNSDLSDEELIDRALRSLFEETYKFEQIEKEKKEKAEREERERKAKAEEERKAKERQGRKRRGFKYFTGYEENTAEIKKTFRKLSKELHPDNMETGDAEAFKAMHNEYERLMK
jgi:hypothetical protein